MFDSILQITLDNGQNVVLGIDKHEDNIELRHYNNLAVAMENFKVANITNMRGSGFGRSNNAHVVLFWRETESESNFESVLTFYLKNSEKMTELKEFYNDTVINNGRSEIRVVRKIRTNTNCNLQDAEKFVSEVLKES